MAPTFHEVHQALKHWHKDGAAGHSLTSLRLHQRLTASGQTVREASRQLLREALTALEAEDDEQATLLCQRFLERLPMKQVAKLHLPAPSTLFKIQNQGIHRLTEILAAWEAALHPRPPSPLLDRLPPAPYTALVGVETLIGPLERQLLDPGPPWFVALEGLGGIGKTALADALVRRVLLQGHFVDVAWVSAQHRSFTPAGSLTELPDPVLTVSALVAVLARQFLGDIFGIGPLTTAEALAVLTTRLHAHPHLIVIDNLETFTDLDALLPTLRRLVGPSRFLLTSRESDPRAADLFHFRVPELTAAQALHLVRQEAQLQNLAAVWELPDETLHPLYQIVGGNPLALRLVVGQLYTYDVATVLADLRLARGAADDLYRYIYQRSWQGLDSVARDALLATPLLPHEGGAFDDLAESCDLTPTQLRAALATLVRQNLVDVRGSADARRYSIHSLTRAFLLEVIAQWL